MRVDESACGFMVEPRFNEPLYREVLGITYDIYHPSNSVMNEKKPRYNEPLYSEDPGITYDIYQPSNSVMNGKNLDKTNLYIAKSSVERTIFIIPVIV